MNLFYVLAIIRNPRHRFAKKMKRLMTILVSLATCLSVCQGQERCALGTDVASIVTSGMTRLNIGYAFSVRWSAEAEIGLNIRQIAKGYTEEENAHWKELYGNSSEPQSIQEDNLIETGISVLFWPGKTYDGPLVSFGCRIRDRGSPDLTAGVGYYCRIWKGLKAVLTYKTAILENMKNRTELEEGLRIGISYAF